MTRKARVEDEEDIITTNRILTFDIVILSSYHHAANLKPPDQRQEAQIWQDFLNQLNENSPDKKNEIQES